MMDILADIAEDLGPIGLFVMAAGFAFCMMLSMLHTGKLRRRGLPSRHSSVATGIFGAGMAAILVLVFFSTMAMSNQNMVKARQAANLNLQVSRHQADVMLQQGRGTASTFTTQYMQSTTAVDHQTVQ